MNDPLAEGGPVRACRPHRIAECVLKLIVRDNNLA
jgi:hypothetical protein